MVTLLNSHGPTPLPCALLATVLYSTLSSDLNFGTAEVFLTQAKRWWAKTEG